MLTYLFAAYALLAGSQLAAQTAATSSGFGYAQLGVYQNVPAHALLAGANQGALGHYKASTAAFYGEKRFLLDALSLFKAAWVLPVASGAFGVEASFFGSAAFSQSGIGLAYGRKLGELVSVGVQFDYGHYHISGYGNAGAVSAQAGVLFRISESFRAGLQVYNPTQSSFFQIKEEKLPAGIAAGFGYAPSRAFYLQATLVKERAQPLNLQAGLQYAFLEKLQVKGGFETASGSGYFGAGYLLPFMQLDAVATFHPQLGISPGLMVVFKEEKD